MIFVKGTSYSKLFICTAQMGHTADMKHPVCVIFEPQVHLCTVYFPLLCRLPNDSPHE